MCFRVFCADCVVSPLEIKPLRRQLGGNLHVGIGCALKKAKPNYEPGIFEFMQKTALAVLVGMAMVPALLADQVTTVNSYGPYQTGQGGEFTLRPDAQLSWVLGEGYVDTVTKNVLGLNGTFQTFCLEGQEFIYPNTTFDVVLGTSAIRGGVGPGGDPLSVGAAWLYHEFLIAGDYDGLAAYDYANPGRSGAGSSADLLQRAIWWLEGEEGEVYNTLNPYEAAVVTKFGSQEGAKGDNNGQYAVMVLNMYAAGHGGDADYLRQDMLVGVPDGGLTLTLLGMGLGSLAMISRRIRK